MPTDKWIIALTPPKSLKKNEQSFHKDIFDNLRNAVTQVDANHLNIRDSIQQTLEKANKHERAVRQYEKDYLATSPRPYKIMKDEVTRRFTNRKENQNRRIRFDEGTNPKSPTEIKVIYNLGRESQTEVVIATVYFDDDRVQKLPSQAGQTNEVYAFRASPTHDTSIQFVKDCHGVLIRRFALRAISEDDKKNLDAGKGITAKMLNPKNNITYKEQANYSWKSGVPTATPDNKLGGEAHTYASPAVSITDEQAVFFQLQKGSQRYISLTTTKHKIYGNKGEPFLKDQNGYIVVDLARIPKEHIYDVHTAAGLSKAAGIPETVFKESISKEAANEITPQDRAARDTIRTREVLVRGAIARDAIVYYSGDVGAKKYDHPKDALFETRISQGT